MKPLYYNDAQIRHIIDEATADGWQVTEVTDVMPHMDGDSWSVKDRTIHALKCVQTVQAPIGADAQLKDETKSVHRKTQKRPRTGGKTGDIKGENVKKLIRQIPENRLAEIRETSTFASDKSHFEQALSPTLPKEIPSDFFRESKRPIWGTQCLTPTDPQTSSAGYDEHPLSGDCPTFDTLDYLRNGDASICIGFDTEYLSADDEPSPRRVILSYQYSTLDVLDPGKLIRVVFIPLREKRYVVNGQLPYDFRLRNSFMLGHVLHECHAPYAAACRSKSLLVKGVPSREGVGYRFPTKDGPKVSTDCLKLLKECTYDYSHALALSLGMECLNGNMTDADFPVVGTDKHFNEFPLGRSRIFELYARQMRIDVTLISHYAKADFTTFAPEPGAYDIMTHVLPGGNGGLFSDLPMKVLCPAPTSRRPDQYQFPVRLSLRDSIAYAAAGHHHLSDLGDVCGVPKLDVGDYISHMDDLLHENPRLFMQYASNDADICMTYMATLMGVGRTFPPTINAAGAYANVKMGEVYFNRGGAKSPSKGFTEVFSGYTSGSDRTGNNLSFAERLRRRPISFDADTVNRMLAASYHGGLNACYRFGIINVDGSEEWHDYDLCSAYPSAMSCIPDLDYSNLISETCRNQPLTPDMFPSPLTPFVGSVSFMFPDGTVQPNIIVLANSESSTPITPLAHTANNGVAVCGVDVWTALQFGAQVFCHTGYFLNTLKRDGEDSRFLREVCRVYVSDREKAQALYGKGSAMDKFFKSVANGGTYGKIAQQVTATSMYNPHLQAMENGMGSQLSSPWHATTTTALVRCMLAMTIAELTSLGYEVLSVTTDGFITNAPEDVLNSVANHGLTALFADARRYIDPHKPTVWEGKHLMRKAWINASTRLNLSTEPGGVLAHGGVQSPFIKDSQEDREWMVNTYASRVAPVECLVKEPTELSKLANADFKLRADFSFTTKVSPHSLDYDLKYMPLIEQGTTEVWNVNGNDCEVFGCPVKPWNTVEEYLDYRRKHQKFYKAGTILRTHAQWELFMSSETPQSRYLSTDKLDRRLLLHIIGGARQGIYNVPILNSDIPLDMKIQWINYLGFGEITVSDWKNCGKPSRLKTINLDESYGRALLNYMQAFNITAEYQKGMKPDGSGGFRRMIQTPTPDTAQAFHAACVRWYRGLQEGIEAPVPEPWPDEPKS